MHFYFKCLAEYRSLFHPYFFVQLHVLLLRSCKSSGWALFNHHAKFTSKEPVFHALTDNNYLILPLLFGVNANQYNFFLWRFISSVYTDPKLFKCSKENEKRRRETLRGFDGLNVRSCWVSYDCIVLDWTFTHTCMNLLRREGRNKAFIHDFGRLFTVNSFTNCVQNETLNFYF